jgi:hypothetical protein
MPAMSPTDPVPVEPCFRCGQPAELPAVGAGVGGGEERGRVPLCTHCLALMLSDPGAFWKPLRRGGAS